MRFGKQTFVALLVLLFMFSFPFDVLAEEVSDPAEQPVPKNGTVNYYSEEKKIAPLEIRTEEGNYYLLKLVNVEGDKTVLDVFIHGGKTVNIEVPLGTYEIRYASGEKWYGYEYLFGDNTMYTKAEGLFEFMVENNQVYGYILTLYSVTNGNLATNPIAPEDF
ncbi:MAG: hypothetical protein UMV23_01390 [Halanaerobium sp.]|nr:hypothetical protein [Halanaerobium sp.]